MRIFNAKKKQADYPFEERRRILILQAPIKGEMCRLFFALTGFSALFAHVSPSSLFFT